MNEQTNTYKVGQIVRLVSPVTTYGEDVPQYRDLVNKLMKVTDIEEWQLTLAPLKGDKMPKRYIWARCYDIDIVCDPLPD